MDYIWLASRKDEQTKMEIYKIIQDAAVMFKEDSIMNEQIRKAIRHRASKARTKTQLVKAVFDSFRSSQIDPRQVSLEDMKIAVMVAARAARAAGQKNPENMPA